MTGKALGAVVIIFILSELSALLVSLWVLWGFRQNEIAKAIGILVAGMAINDCFQFVSNLSRPEAAHYSAWFIFWWSGGRIFQTAGVWALARFLTKVRSGSVNFN